MVDAQRKLARSQQDASAISLDREVESRLTLDKLDREIEHTDVRHLFPCLLVMSDIVALSYSWLDVAS